MSTASTDAVTAIEEAVTTSADASAAGPDVRWLTAEQQRHWRTFRDATVMLLDVLGRDLDERSGLSLHEYEVMVRLSEADGHTLRMSQLASTIAHSRSRLTHTIARMEAAGLVRRVACSSDARGVNCVLTDDGWAALVAAAPWHVAAVREHLVDRLSDQQLAALGDAMEAVRAHLRGECSADDVR
ncbi:MAG TPA: MarR family winged helix-turn-helix transcriptional regulator [Cellulomonas sp.]